MPCVRRGKLRVLYCCYRRLYCNGHVHLSLGSVTYLMPELARHFTALSLLAPVVRGTDGGGTRLSPCDRLRVVPVHGFRARWAHLLSGDLWSIRALRQFVGMQRRVDVLVMCVPSAMYYSAFMAFVRKPLVAVVSGDEQGLMRRSTHLLMRVACGFGVRMAKRMVEQRLLRRASAIVCRNEQLADRCRRTVGYAVPIHIITSGIDTEVFLPCAGEERSGMRRSLGLDGAAPIVGFVATSLSDEKGAHVMRLAFARVREVLPSAQLLVVGEDRGILCDDEGVVHCGWVSHDDLPQYYGSMDVFACPSLSEGAPKVVMEACASGVPVVASRVGAIQEWFESGQNGHCGPSGQCGLAVDAGDSEAMANACLSLLSDANLRACIGANARTLAISRFDYRTCAAQLADVLRTAACGGPQ